MTMRVSPPPVVVRHTGAWVVAATTVALVGTFAWALYAGGALDRGPAWLPDGGPLVTGGVPAARLVHQCAAVLTLGFLLGAAMFGPRQVDGTMSPVALRHLRGAGVTATIWAFAAAFHLVFTAADLTGRPVTRVDTATFLNIADTAQGRALLTAVAAGVIVRICVGRARRAGLVAAALLVTVAGIAPLAFAGHAATSGDHNTATTSLVGHVVAASSWVGGLVALVVHARWHPSGLPLAARRFSRLALVCFLAVTASGLLNAWLRLGTWRNLDGNGYALIIQLKLLAVVVLAALGWWHRERTLPALDADQPRERGLFARFATGEAVVMAVTMGLAVALSRSTPPPLRATGEHDFVRMLLGYPMPAAPSVTRLLLDWRLELFFTTGCAVAVALYLIGVRRLRRDGLRWSWWRTLSWLAGCLVIMAATSGGLARYGPLLLSVHVIQYVLAAVLAPILLMLGAPVLLAQRALRPGTDAAYPGPREWLTAALDSRPARLLGHPAAAAALWTGGVYGVYLTGAYEYTLRFHPAHLAMYAYVIGSGCLFFATLMAPPHSPARPVSPRVRGLVLLAALLGHAVFAVVLMASTEPIAAAWFADIRRPWGPDPLTDQRLGAAVAWAVGQLPALVVAMVMLRRWLTADEHPGHHGESGARPEQRTTAEHDRLPEAVTSTQR